jgi:hypothetical protein
MSTPTLTETATFEALRQPLRRVGACSLSDIVSPRRLLRQTVAPVEI